MEKGDKGETGMTGPVGPRGPQGRDPGQAMMMLPGAFERLTEALHRDNLRRRWQALAFAILLVLAIGQSYNNGKVIAKINSVTGPEAQVRQAASTRDILARNAQETDCRNRRLSANLPAPAVAPPPPADVQPQELGAYFQKYSCANQTDPSIYPGVTTGAGTR